MAEQAKDYSGAERSFTGICCFGTTLYFNLIKFHLIMMFPALRREIVACTEVARKNEKNKTKVSLLKVPLGPFASTLLIPGSDW